MTKPKVTITSDPASGLIAGDGYQFYRDGAIIAGSSTPLPSPLYTDNDAALDWGQSHTYQVSAGQAGRIGPWSDPVTVVLTQPPDTTPPTAPARPTVTSVTTTAIGITWPDNPEVDIAYYVVERATGATIPGTFTTLAAKVPDNAYTDSTVVAGTTYWYRVRAGDTSDNISAPSQTVSAQATATPATPTGLAVTTPTPHTASLTWNAVSGAGGYSVYRNGNLVAAGVQTNSYVDNLEPSDYIYQVAAGIAPNLSPLSTAVAAQVFGVTSSLPSSFQFPSSHIGDPAQTWQVSLTGRGSFAITFDVAWLTASPSSGSLSDVAVTVTVTSNPTSPGSPLVGNMNIAESAAPTGPMNTSKPTVSGTGRVSGVLTGNVSSWSGTPTSYTKKFYRSLDGATWTQVGSTVSSSATSSTYTPVSGDLGYLIRYGVAATNAQGTSAEVFSDPFGPITAAPTAPVNTGLPTLGGTMQSGQAITTTAGAWSTVDPPTSYTWKWQRETAAGSLTPVDITGATGTGTTIGFTLTGSEVGLKVRVSVTATNAQGSTTVVSAWSSTVTSTTPSVVLAQKALSLDGTTGGRVQMGTSFGAGGQPLALGGLSYLIPISGRTSQAYTLMGWDQGDASITPSRALQWDVSQNRAGWKEQGAGLHGVGGFPSGKWVYWVATRNNDSANTIRATFCDLSTGVWATMYEGAISVVAPSTTGTFVIGSLTRANVGSSWAGYFLAGWKGHAFLTEAQMQAPVLSSSSGFYVDPALLLSIPSVESVWLAYDPANPIQDRKSTANETSRTAGVTVFDSGAPNLPLKVN